MRTLALLAAAALVALPSLAGAASPPPGKRVAQLERLVRQLRAEKAILAQRDSESLRRERALARRLAHVDPCHVTTPNLSVPPGSTFGSAMHGNGRIWVGLWPANVVVWEPSRDGSIDAKFGWWRGVEGALRISGRRLDGAAPPLRADVPSGYGDRGFQATGIRFPAAGCWQVTGRVGDAELTFVTLVVAAT
jgi:hypothetical protein